VRPLTTIDIETVPNVKHARQLGADRASLKLTFLDNYVSLTHMHIRQVPLTALRAFALTAQSGSVTRAADELSVTHGAISRQISTLEVWLGLKLFDRRGKRLKLTPIGELLADQIGLSLGSIVSICTELRGSRQHRIISLEAPATFAMYWLLPRIVEYERREKSIQINLLTRQTNDPVNFSNSDLLVTRGMGSDQLRQFPKRHVLFYEDMTVLAAPAFLKRYPIRKADDVLVHPRVSASTRPDDWMQWAATAGLRDSQQSLRHHFDHLFVALHAVRDGVGSIIAPRNLFQVGAKKQFTTPVSRISFQGRPYVIHSRSSSEPFYIDNFLQWLRQQCAA
jgi:DNA-binding transcriptional LysR family regulator